MNSLVLYFLISCISVNCIRILWIALIWLTKYINFADIIDELLKSGKEIEAAYFASESGLTESLLKSCLRNSKKNATTILKKGNYSNAVQYVIFTFF